MMFLTLTSSASSRTGVVNTFRCVTQINRMADVVIDDPLATLLMQFAANVHDVGVQRLLREGADPNSATSKGMTAIMFAVLPNEFGDDYSPQAIRKVVDRLLKFGADPTLADSCGLSAIDYARQLADPDRRDTFGDRVGRNWSADTAADYLAIVSQMEAANAG